MENESQNYSIKQEEKQGKLEQEEKTPGHILASGVFWLFLIATCVAFLLHIFGFDWIVEKTAVVEEPPVFLQKIILAFLKAFELLFAYRLLTHKAWSTCFILAILQAVLTGFLPAGIAQGTADTLAPLVFALIFRKERLTALLDWVLLEVLMNAYSLLFMIASFGGFNLSYGYSFWANIVSLIDYKLFIVTVYAYAKSKGGISLWKMKRKLFLLP